MGRSSWPAQMPPHTFDSVIRGKLALCAVQIDGKPLLDNQWIMITLRKPQGLMEQAKAVSS